MEIIKMPRPVRWVWASLGAFWLADIIHPGFFSVSVMALVMIPILILDLSFPPQPPKFEPYIPEGLEAEPEEEAEVIENEQEPV